PPSEFRGTATRYGREHLLRLAAIGVLKEKERLHLDAVRRRLQALTPAQLETYAPIVEPPPPASVAPAVEQAPVALESAPAVSPFGALAPSTYASDRWDRLALLPGVELFVRADASPLARRLVQDIHDHCASVSGAGPP